MEYSSPFKTDLAELLIHYFPELRGKGRHLILVEIQVGRTIAEVSRLSIAKLDTPEPSPAFEPAHTEPSGGKSVL